MGSRPLCVPGRWAINGQGGSAGGPFSSRCTLGTSSGDCRAYSGRLARTLRCGLFLAPDRSRYILAAGPKAQSHRCVRCDQLRPSPSLDDYRQERVCWQHPSQDAPLAIASCPPQQIQDGQGAISCSRRGDTQRSWLATVGCALSQPLGGVLDTAACVLAISPGQRQHPAGLMPVVGPSVGQSAYEDAVAPHTDKGASNTTLRSSWLPVMAVLETPCRTRRTFGSSYTVLYSCGHYTTTSRPGALLEEVA